MGLQLSFRTTVFFEFKVIEILFLLGKKLQEQSDAEAVERDAHHQGKDRALETEDIGVIS